MCVLRVRECMCVGVGVRVCGGGGGVRECVRACVCVNEREKSNLGMILDLCTCRLQLTEHHKSKLAIKNTHSACIFTYEDKQPDAVFGGLMSIS